MTFGEEQNQFISASKLGSETREGIIIISKAGESETVLGEQWRYERGRR